MHRSWPYEGRIGAFEPFSLVGPKRRPGRDLQHPRRVYFVQRETTTAPTESPITFVDVRNMSRNASTAKISVM